MAVAFRAAGTFANANPCVVSYPAGVASGDLLVIQYALHNSATPNTPAGWTKLLGPLTPSGGLAERHYVFYKVAGGSEPSTVSITLSAGGPANGYATMTAYTGADPVNPINASASATTPTSGTTLTTPSVTTTVANTLLIRMYSINNTSTTITPPGTDTERYDTFEPARSYVYELATQPVAGIGATGTTTATCGTTTFGGTAITIAISPPTGAAPVANFTGTPLSGPAPLSVTFTDSSTNVPTSWAWTFGDGGTSTSQNPTRNYTTPGVYTVTLVATNATGSDTKTRTAYVTVQEPIVYAAAGGITIN